MVRRARPVRDRIVPVVVERLTREFKYPETDPGPQGVPILGAGGGAPTIVLAAANALDIEKAKADILCSGVNDEQFIQAAINSLLFGGRLLFTSGTFHINFAGSANCVATGGFSGITFEGMGTDATIFNVEDSRGGSSIDRFAFEFTDADIAVKNFTLQGGSGALGATNGIALGNQSLASNVIFNTDGIGVQMLDGEIICDGCQFLNSGIGIELFGNGGVVTNCHIDAGGFGISLLGGVFDAIIKGNRIRSTGDGINIDNATLCTISGNTFSNVGGYGINLNNDAVIRYIAITGNSFWRCDDGAIRGEAPWDVAIVGNSIAQSSFTGTDAAIEMGPANLEGAGLVIADNIIDASNHEGILVDNYDEVQIMGNQIREVDGHGISLNDVTNSKVADNVILVPGQDAANTFDGIILSGDSDDNYIHGNQVIAGVASPRYAINISAATCDCNIVVGNALGDPAGYGTDALNDAGTNTQLFYPSDGTYGDNFTVCPPVSS